MRMLNFAARSLLGARFSSQDAASGQKKGTTHKQATPLDSWKSKWPLPSASNADISACVLCPPNCSSSGSLCISISAGVMVLGRLGTHSSPVVGRRGRSPLVVIAFVVGGPRRWWVTVVGRVRKAARHESLAAEADTTQGASGDAMRHLCNHLMEADRIEVSQSRNIGPKLVDGVRPNFADIRQNLAGTSGKVGGEAGPNSLRIRAGLGQVRPFFGRASDTCGDVGGGLRTSCRPRSPLSTAPSA